MPTKTQRREFLQLAGTYNPLKHNIAGFYISEKLDGTRCFWDGGISRGIPTVEVPWASVIDPKTGRQKAKIKPVSTGLWSRYGNPIMAPDWYLNTLPACPLDGELWAGRGNFQLCRSICAGDEPDPRFDKIQFAVYSSPAFGYVFRDGEIKNTNFHSMISQAEVERWTKDRLHTLPDYSFLVPPVTFEGELLFLREAIPSQDDQVFLHRQVKLPNDPIAAQRAADSFLTSVLDQGGEGVVLRDPASCWTPKRHNGLLKFKPYHDSEATVTGFISGREGKQGNVLGKIGALLVNWNGVDFEIGSGLTFEERELTPEARAWATSNPGVTIPSALAVAEHFKVGDTITFKYRELSDDGVPKEARFWRKRGNE